MVSQVKREESDDRQIVYRNVLKETNEIENDEEKGGTDAVVVDLASSEEREKGGNGSHIHLNGHFCFILFAILEKAHG